VDSNEYRFRNFDTTGFSTRIADAETGLLIQVFLVKGLSLGAFVPVPVSAQSIAVTYANTNFDVQWSPAESLVLNAEYNLPKTPFTLGASASYGNGDVWGLSGLDLNPYVRYGFSGSSVRVGTDVTYGTDWVYKVQFAYTVGF
jgi:hypothetical protein